jgi:hypothetical protein
MNLLQIQTFRNYYIARFLILNFPGFILDLRLLPITLFITSTS